MSERDLTTPVEFRPVEGFPGYRVGDDGSVWSRKNNHGWLTDRWRRMAATPNPKGYPYVTLCIKRKRTGFPVSRLVLMAFVGPRPEGAEACHKNDDRADNRRENLEWGTHAENVGQRQARGRQARGESNGSAKLTEGDVSAVLTMAGGGSSYRKIAAVFGVGPGAVGSILRGRTWRHLTRTPPD